VIIFEGTALVLYSVLRLYEMYSHGNVSFRGSKWSPTRTVLARV
jgi:hypothetical protein